MHSSFGCMAFFFKGGQTDFNIGLIFCHTDKNPALYKHNELMKA